MKLFQIRFDGDERKPLLQIRTMLAVLLLVGVTGCSAFLPRSRGQSSDNGTLDGALAGLVPLPFDDATRAKMSSGERADFDAASAAALAFGDADLTHFTEAGDPILRTGLMLSLSVRVGDKLEVEPMAVQILGNGDISLPMIGTVVCEGLTLPQLKRLLEERYGAYYRDPDIALSFIYDEAGVSPWGRVLVQGRVMREGWVNIPPTRDLTVSEAIQKAAGYSTSAKKNAIIVTRRKSGGEKVVLRVDLERVGRRGEVERDIALLPGDVIYVPERNY